jgi:NhaP-type Na+/H+ or K+/H+ antiporter
MNAFEVYLMMLCDDVITACIFASVFGFIGGIATAIATSIRFSCVVKNADGSYVNDSDYRTWVAFKKWRNTLLPIAFISTFTAVFVPSTKTVALMVAIPALTSPQAQQTYKQVGGDAQQLFDLAAKALQKAAGKNDDKK